MSVRKITKKSDPKYKFGETVLVDDPFFGNIEGTIQDYNHIVKGHLWWKQEHKVYTLFVRVMLNDEEYMEMNVIAAEDAMKKKIDNSSKPRHLSPVD